MRLNLKLSQQGLVLISLPLVCEFIFVFTLVELQRRTEIEAQRVAHSRAVISELDAIGEFIYDIVAANFMYGITRRASARERGEELAARLAEHRDKLNRLSGQDSKERQLIIAIDKDARQANQLLSAARQAIAQGTFRNWNLGRSTEVQELGARYSTSVRHLIEYEKLSNADAPAAELRYRSLLRTCIMAGVAGNSLLSAVLLIVFNKTTASRLRVLLQNTVNFAKREKLSSPLAGSDELAQLDTSFHEMTRTIEKAEDLKRQFVNMLSHDLRTPMTSLQFMLENFRLGVYGDVSNKAKQRLDGSITEVSRLIGLINQLLDIEKMECGKMEMDFAEVASSALIKTSCDSVRQFAESKRIELKESSYEATMWGDRDRLVQVLVNLLSNAVKFSPDGSHVTINVSERDSYVEITVHDCGRGIPADAIGRLFGRFAQVEATDQTQKGGTGLGLAICKAIIDEHKGSIGVDSKVGDGSTFWFRVPKVTATQSEISR